jgi:glycosyltransferase involved in cell wall biosynthesis
MIFTVDPLDQGAISGMPYAAARALERRGLTVIPLESGNGLSTGPSSAPTSGGIAGAKRKLKALLKRRLPQRMLEWPSRWRSRGDGLVLREAKLAAERVQARIAMVRRERELDAIVGMCVSVPLAFLETDLPIVYASDATARIVLTTYPRYARRSQAYRDECEECERRALHRASIVGLASEVAVRSAIEDYGIEPQRVGLLPLGSHVVPDAESLPQIVPPTRDDLKLLLVASDPERKRLGFSVDIVRELRRRGVKAELVHIGAPHRHLRAPCVRTLGALRLSHAADRLRHLAAIRESHLSLLPSIGEAFGIAPAESALAGRPAIVSDAGGLPTVVRDGQTGIVLSVCEPVSAWADAMERLIDDPDRYRCMAIAARERAWREFTWDAWAETVEGMARWAMAERRAAAAPVPLSRRNVG